MGLSPLCHLTKALADQAREQRLAAGTPASSGSTPPAQATGSLAPGVHTAAGPGDGAP